MKLKFCKKCKAYGYYQGNGPCESCNVKWQKRVLEISTKWQENNPGKVAATAKRNADNLKKAKAVAKASSQNRRTSKLYADGAHTAEDICAITTYQNNLCACCATSIEDGYHVDHIEPISKGGSNDRSNLQALCALCNLSKHADHPVEFMKQRRPKMIKAWAAALLRRREVIGF